MKRGNYILKCDFIIKKEENVVIEYSTSSSSITILIPKHWEKLSINDLFTIRWKVPKKTLHTWRMSKQVLLNNERVDWKEALSEKDELSVPIFLYEETLPVTAANLNISILYEDDFLLIANKPANMNTHSTDTADQNSLLNGVAHYLKSTGQRTFIKHIHRLDKDTTGAILFAKNPVVGAMLDRMLEEREIKRTYYALAMGIIKKSHGTINAKIGRDRHHPTRRRVSHSGQHAITHYQVLKHFSDKSQTLVSCTLESGRTHQIRVHFSYLGHPLAGDSLYGGNQAYSRQALHARKIEFKHPILEKKITCIAPFIDHPVIFPENI